MGASPFPPLLDLLSLAGRVAVVTGAARGIGAAVVARFVEAKAVVVAADISWDDRPPPKSAGVFSCDVTAADGVDALVRAALADGGRLDVWVNAAGAYPSAPLLDLEDADWDALLDLNLRACFRGARAAARAMVAAASGGVIVNVVSNAGMAAGPASAHYVTSKHGLVGLTKSLATDLGQHGIRAVGVAPGVTWTEGLAARAVELRDGGWGDLEAYAARTVPLGRMATPDEIARVVLFAASDLAAYVSGTTLLVDGGQVTSLSP